MDGFLLHPVDIKYYIYDFLTDESSVISLQMIIRLKKEIQSLKDQLSMVTGEHRNDELTAEEIQKYAHMFTI